MPSKSVRFRLNHFCYLPGAEGTPGDVVSIPDDVAKVLLERGGGEVVTDDPTEKATEKPKEQR